MRELGRGGMGIVYLAHDALLQRDIAIKLLYPSFTLDDASRERLLREARMLASLRHPGVVQIHALEEVEGTWAIVMEYLEGTPLSGAMSDGAVSEDVAIGLVRDCLKVLADCHARGIVHCDVKPANIILTDDGRVVLTDFGLASTWGQTTAVSRTSATFVGTPKYAPPEAWAGKAPTPGWDVYACGMVLLELLAGRSPHDSNTPMEILRKMAHEYEFRVREFLPEADENLVKSIQALISIDPRLRIVDAREALTRLDALASPNEAPRQEKLPHTPKWISHLRLGRQASRRLALMAGLSLLAVFLGVGITSQQFRPPDTPSAESQSLESGATSTPVASSSPPEMAKITGFSPQKLAWTDGHLVFSASLEGEDASIWSLDTESKSVERLLGPVDGVMFQVDDQFRAGAKLLFLVQRATEGPSLYSSGGTAASTRELLRTLSSEDRILLLGAGHEMFYFNARFRTMESRLWQTDGTISGTRELETEWNESYFDTIAFTTNGAAFIGSHDGHKVRYLPNGETMAYVVGDFPGPVVMLASMGDYAIVAAMDQGVGIELWRVGRLATEVTLVKDVYPGEESGCESPELTSFGDKVLFRGMTPEHGEEPWITDGTPEGTFMLRDIEPGPRGSDPYRFIDLVGKAAFCAVTSKSGREVYITDGTADSTRMVADIAPGPESAEPYSFCRFKEGMLFGAYDPAHGEELWYTDGTSANTILVAQIFPGPVSSGPHGMVVAGAYVFFAATGPRNGRTLWITDGTTEGTKEYLAGLPAVPAANR